MSRFTETGVGVLVSADGKVMTAAHVVHAMDEIALEFLGSEPVGARVISSEPGADLSLIQLERVPSGAKVATMANSDKVAVGDQVVVVGAPYGLSYSLSVGHISARYLPNTVYDRFPLAEFFQTDATINTGNSGGPLFSMTGAPAARECVPREGRDTLYLAITLRAVPRCGRRPMFMSSPCSAGWRRRGRSAR